MYGFYHSSINSTEINCDRKIKTNKRTLQRDLNFCLKLLSQIKYINHYLIVSYCGQTEFNSNSKPHYKYERITKCLQAYLVITLIISSIMGATIQTDHPYHTDVYNLSDVYDVICVVSITKPMSLIQ